MIQARPRFRAIGLGTRGPVEAAEAVRDLPYVAVLESAIGSAADATYSYVTADPFLVFQAKGQEIRLTRGGAVTNIRGNPFTTLQSLLRDYTVMPIAALPPFQGGAIGYVGYEAGKHIERLPGLALDDLKIPDFQIGFYDWVLAFDNRTGEAWAVATGLPSGSPDAAERRLDEVLDRLHAVPTSLNLPPPLRAGAVTSNFTKESYLAAIRKVKEYVVAGEIYQANLSQRFRVEIGDIPPWQIFQRLRETSPAPFSAYLEYPDAAIVSASPEEFLRLQHRVVRTRPMKGTRPRGANPEQDVALAEALRSSVKDQAENVMIVDLMRSDLGKVCVPGSITVPHLFAIERYSTVFQMVSTIVGELLPGVDAVDLFKACFPGGSVTGAPKIRASEIIDELEPHQRSVYCGAIGYIGFDGSMVTSIPIRTLIVKDGVAYCPVGGAIVFDSDPEDEYQETLHKARGAFEALGISLG